MLDGTIVIMCMEEDKSERAPGPQTESPLLFYGS